MLNSSGQKPWWEPGLEVFVQVTGWVAVPIIGALFIGRWLDERYQSDPWFFLSLTGLAFVISSIGIVRTAVSAMREVESMNKEKKDEIPADESKNKYE